MGSWTSAGVVIWRGDDVPFAPPHSVHARGSENDASGRDRVIKLSIRLVVSVGVNEENAMRYLRYAAIALVTFVFGVAISPIHFYAELIACGFVPYRGSAQPRRTGQIILYKYRLHPPTIFHWRKLMRCFIRNSTKRCRSLS